MTAKFHLQRGGAKWAVVALLIAGLVILALFWLFQHRVVAMPGSSYKGPLPALTPPQRALQGSLAKDVAVLLELGPRHAGNRPALAQAADYIEGRLRKSTYVVRRQSVDLEGGTVANIEAELAVPNKRQEIVLLTAHYDSAPASPGANDNAAGTAVLLALADALGPAAPARSVRFLAFANGNAPHSPDQMTGSRRYAQQCRKKGENIVAVLALDSMGYYSEEPASQSYPFPFSLFYPTSGSFVAFVGSIKSAYLLRTTIGSFRKRTAFPSEGAALPTIFSRSSLWSEVAPFWQQEYPAVMVWDTGAYRYPHHQTPQDTFDRIDFEKLARVTEGLIAAVRDLLQ